MSVVNFDTIEKILKLFQNFDDHELTKLSTDVWTISVKTLEYYWVKPKLPKYIKQTYELLELMFLFPICMEQDRLCTQLKQPFRLQNSNCGTLKSIHIPSLLRLGETTSQQVWEILAEPDIQDIIQTISDHIRSRMHLPCQLDFTFEKVVVIKQEGKFEHAATNHTNENLFGRLIICLPSKHDGGSIALGAKSKPYLTFPSDSSSISWTILFGNDTHEHLPVTSGTQILAMYKINLGREAPEIPNSPTVAYMHWEPLLSCPVLPQLSKFLAKELDGSSIGILLSKKYADKKYSLDMLEGRDKQVTEALHQQGCKFEIIPVMFHQYVEQSQLSAVYSFNQDDINHVIGEGPSPQHARDTIPFFFMDIEPFSPVYAYQDYSEDSDNEDSYVEAGCQKWYLVPALIAHFPTLWDRSRLLWIARKKNSPVECPISVLPNDIIRYIISMLKSEAKPNLKKRKREAEDKSRKKQVIVISSDEEDSSDDDSSDDDGLMLDDSDDSMHHSSDSS